MKITFNAPFTLIFTFAAIGAGVLSVLTGGSSQQQFFSVYAPITFTDPLSILRLFTYTLGHANWSHFTSNFAIILLIGPFVEDCYGSWRLCFMTLITAAVTAFLHVSFFQSGLMGASGISFMLILLGSLTNSRRGSIPLSFLLVSVIYLGNECVSMMKQDNISQLVHIAGGLCGALFGFIGQTKSPGKKANE